jgi:zinc and cadmium transporter
MVRPRTRIPAAMPAATTAILPSVTSAVALGVGLALIAAAAFAGGASAALVSLGHRPRQVLLSLTGGVLLGVGMLHLLPHACLELGGNVDAAAGWALGGFFLMFLLERAFHAHAHHAVDEGCGHDHGADGRGATAPHHHHGTSRGRWAWCGALAGLTLHSLADGAALAASVRADALHGAGLFAGFATFLAILLHKPLDAGIIATLMVESGVPPRWRTLVNAAYAAVVPIGAAAFLVSLPFARGREDAVLGIALALAAGAFICIAAADLLPEVQFHSHDRVLLTTALVMGLAIAWGMTMLERSSHGHASHGHGPAAAVPRP